jgi:hypothetical protein
MTKRKRETKESPDVHEKHIIPLAKIKAIAHEDNSIGRISKSAFVGIEVSICIKHLNSLTTAKFVLP